MKFPSDQFDLIYSASVLEHIHDLEKSLLEMARVLRPGGMMIHEFPSYFAPDGGALFLYIGFSVGARAFIKK
jgi:ubiquinone/menaquinone biosynthesis C-methylase UbiE